MKKNKLLAYEEGLVSVYRICGQFVQVNLIPKGISLYFTTESFFNFAEALREGSVNLTNFYLSEMFYESNNNSNEEREEY